MEKGANGKRFGLENIRFDLFHVVRLLPPYKMLCQHFSNTACLIDKDLALGMIVLEMDDYRLSNWLSHRFIFNHPLLKNDGTSNLAEKL